MLLPMLITCQFPGKHVPAGGVSARVRSKQAAGEAMGLKEVVGAPFTRPRHTWETGGGGEAAVTKRAEGGRGGQLCEGCERKGCLR